MGLAQVLIGEVKKRAAMFGFMGKSQLQDAFDHHVWATQRLIDTCTTLTDSQLEAGADGTFGSIIGTMRHLVGADSAYLFALTEGRVAAIDDSAMGLAELRAVMDTNGAAWSALVGQELDPDETVVRYRDDGSEGHAPRGIRMAQALHHGTDHRSQICTILTTMGIEPPMIDVWDFAEQDGRLSEVPPATGDE